MVSPGGVNESILLSIGSGEVTPQKVYLKVDSDKQGYIEYPDGTYQATVAGVIDTTWNHSAGAIRLIVPKNTTEVSISAGGVAGAYRGVMKINSPITKSLCHDAKIDGYIARNNTSTYNVSFNSNITFVDAPKARIAIVHSCPNLPTSNLYKIIDDMYQLYLDGVNLTGGILNLGGTTKAIDVAEISINHSELYSEITNELEGAGVTITINHL